MQLQTVFVANLPFETALRLSNLQNWYYLPHDFNSEQAQIDKTNYRPTEQTKLVVFSIVTALLTIIY